MNDNKTTIEESYASLPAQVRNFIDSKDLENVIYDIGKNNRLHIDQTSDLEDLISLTIIGKIKRPDFKKKLELVLNIDKDQVETITREINDKIFVYINEILRNTTNPQAGLPNQIYEDTKNIDTLEVINAISNPTSIPTSSTVTEKAPSLPTPPPKTHVAPKAPLPDMPQAVISDDETLAMKKFTEVTTNLTKTTEQNIVSKKSLIPSDHIDRINSDPYKENI